MANPNQIVSDYEKRLLKKQKKLAEQINQYISDLINTITPLASTQKLPNGVFELSKLPLLNNLIDQQIRRLTTQIEVDIRSGIKYAWELSNTKNDLIADIRLASSKIPNNKQAAFYDTNSKALQAFEERKIAGLNLSERIYDLGQQLKSELEAGLGLGISKGQSAAEMGRDLKQYLKDPDKLFRRVRDEKGNLKLSKNAKAFNPGQGVYRSSIKNIQRLTRTETNIAYRTADMKRYENMPFVLGYEVKLSAQHPKFDVCDFMKGEYPVTFVFTGWHPQCLCFVVPVLMSTEQFKQYQQLVLNGTDTPENINKIASQVKQIPDSASEWINNNKERIAGWKKLPLWWEQNSNYVPDLNKNN